MQFMFHAYYMNVWIQKARSEILQPSVKEEREVLFSFHQVGSGRASVR